MNGVADTNDSAHQAHNYAALTVAWKNLARQSGDFSFETFAEHDAHDITVFRSLASEPATLYVSAGIHGDEPAGPWGLLRWAEENVGRLAELPVIFFPCLNPWGLVENRRSDSTGRDLNRSFHSKEIPMIAAWHELMRGNTICLAVCLHEDYDGTGLYLYDLNRESSHGSSEELLRRCSREGMPVETREVIETRAATRGVIERAESELDNDLKSLDGMPEAVELFLNGNANRTMTFETPSEFAFYDRVKAHKRFLDAVMRFSTRRPARWR